MCRPVHACNTPRAEEDKVGDGFDTELGNGSEQHWDLLGQGQRYANRRTRAEIGQDGEIGDSQI